MTEDKKPVAEEKRYAIITCESIRSMGESAGHTDIAADVLGVLAEDVTYRLREIAQKSVQFMRHAKRKRLSTGDFVNAAKSMDVPPILGHGSAEPVVFRHTKDKELFFYDVKDVSLCNLALDGYASKSPGDSTVTAEWLTVEGVKRTEEPVVKQEPTLEDKSPPPITPVSDDLMSYYENLTKAILCSDNELMKIALKDLRHNPKIVPILPYFVNFVANGVRTVSYDITQLTKMLHTTNALISNKHFYLEPIPYLSILTQCLLYCVLEPLASSLDGVHDQWALRDYGARLLAKISRRWTSPMNELQDGILQSLSQALHDFNKPFSSHYGAIMGLLSFGFQTVEELLIPHLSAYWPHLQVALADMSHANGLMRSDAQKVHGALLLVAELLLKEKIRRFQEQVTETLPVTQVLENMLAENSDMISSSGDHTNVLTLSDVELYQELHQYFGDSLSIKLPQLDLRHVFKATKKELLVKLGDAVLEKSGEELFEDFMEQVRQQQKEDAERMKREQEELERKRKEMEEQRKEQERLRQEQEEIDRQRKEEEERLRWEQIQRMEIEQRLLEQEQKQREEQQLMEQHRLLEERRHLQEQQMIQEQRRLHESLLRQQQQQQEELQLQQVITGPADPAAIYRGHRASTTGLTVTADAHRLGQQQPAQQLPTTEAWYRDPGLLSYQLSLKEDTPKHKEKRFTKLKDKHQSQSHHGQQHYFVQPESVPGDIFSADDSDDDYDDISDNDDSVEARPSVYHHSEYVSKEVESDESEAEVMPEEEEEEEEEEDEDVDVEDDSEQSNQSFHSEKSDRSDKSEEVYSGSESSSEMLAVKSTVTDPSQGIKLIIRKETIKLSPTKEMSPEKLNRASEKIEKPEKHRERVRSKKRKQSQKLLGKQHESYEVKRRADLLYQFEGAGEMSKSKTLSPKKTSHYTSHEQVYKDKPRGNLHVKIKIPKPAVEDVSAESS